MVAKIHRTSCSGRMTIQSEIVPLALEPAYRKPAHTGRSRLKPPGHALLSEEGSLVLCQEQRRNAILRPGVPEINQIIAARPSHLLAPKRIDQKTPLHDGEILKACQPS